MPAPVPRSPLAARLPAGAVFGGLAFRDLTLVAHAGVKGRGTRAWLTERGYGPLPIANRAMRGATGIIVAMLADSEALLLHPTAGAVPPWTYADGVPLAPGVYPTPRGEGMFWITIAGAPAPEMFASVCGVDLRPQSFADLQVAQTIVARSTAIVIRDDAISGGGFHVLGDISLASYLVEQLVDASNRLK